MEGTTFLLRIYIVSHTTEKINTIDFFVLEDTANNKKAYILGEAIHDIADPNPNIMLFNNLIIALNEKRRREEKDRELMKSISENAISKHALKYFLGRYRTGFVALVSNLKRHENEVLNCMATSNRVSALLQPTCITLKRTALLDPSLSAQERGVLKLGCDGSLDTTAFFDNFDEQTETVFQRPSFELIEEDCSEKTKEAKVAPGLPKLDLIKSKLEGDELTDRRKQLPRSRLELEGITHLQVNPL